MRRLLLTAALAASQLPLLAGGSAPAVRADDCYTLTMPSYPQPSSVTACQPTDGSITYLIPPIHH